MNTDLTTTEIRLRQAVTLYFAHANSYKVLTTKQFALFVGVSQATVYRVFPSHEWARLREAWFRDRLLQAMDALYPLARTQQDFTAELIGQHAGVPAYFVHSYLQNEWKARQATLPTPREKVLATLQQLVEANTPLAQMSWDHVFTLAGVCVSNRSSWFSHAYQATYLELARRSQDQAIQAPSGESIRLIPGGWIDLESSVWDLRPAGSHVLRRERLREDFADVAWSLLREELYAGELSIATVDNHYQAFITLRTLLSPEVPNVRTASLEMVQRAWLRQENTEVQRMKVRAILAQLFEKLYHEALHDSSIERTQMLRISGWLNDLVTVSQPKGSEAFLSEAELNMVLRGCLADITTGIAYMSTNPDLLLMSLHPFASENARPLARWAIALMIALMAFTGLRRESVLRLKIDDWTEIQLGLCALAWRHNKKGEEHVAVLPSPLARLLQMYVSSTAQVRSALNTSFVFLGNDRGHWGILTRRQFHYCLHQFTERYSIKRDGDLIPLTSTLFRRTYATRVLYEGRSLGALRLQFGHVSLATTLRYTKFDRYEHPAEVGDALEAYGRKALILWKTPLTLDDLDPAERASLLGEKVARQQDTGLCRHNHCVHAQRGNPPPCSLCEHLVTGPEFLPAWKAERISREQELQRLATEPGSGLLLAQKQFQFECFETNFALVHKRELP